MKKLIVGVVISMLVAGCSGSSDSTTRGRIIGLGGSSSSSTSSSSGNSSSVSSSISSVTTVLSLGTGTGAGFMPGAIALSTASLAAGGSATLGVTLVDQDGIPYQQSATITFSSSCITLGTALLTDGNGTTITAITTSTGSATATYIARGCSGADVITASAVANNQSLTATATITVQASVLGQVVFLSATPNTIGLKGTGVQETSTLVFQVVDSTGGPVNGASVTFGLSTSVGGISLSSTTATSGADGKVQTVVKSGTVHTSVIVNATAVFNGVTQSTQSSNLSVSTGIPTTNGFSLASTCPNVEGFNYDGTGDVVTVRLSDRYNNPVSDGTAITFTTDGGKIGSQCTTKTTDTESGVCSVNWTSQNPRPANGRATILATALGEDSFVDANVNGFYDSGESYIDLGEPFEDDNESGTYTANEFYMDFNKSGSYDATYGSFKGITCTGSLPSSTCTLSTVAIGRQLVIVMSTSDASIKQVGAQSPSTSTNGGSVTVLYNIKDINGNAMANGTTVTIAANTAAGTLDEPTSFTVGCDPSTNGLDVIAYLTRPATPAALIGAAITVTVKAPNGNVSIFRTPIN